MRVLGIETSCDETGIAIYDDEKGLLANQLYSQVKLHADYGGVVPELASRDHVRKTVPLIQAALKESGLTAKDIDAVAYTAGPGLVGALLVGATVGRSLAFAWDVPAIPVHHMEGHLLAPMLEDNPPEFPFVALLVSGGHTQLISVTGIGQYELLGESIDDAAGEAFDKTAKLLGLDYALLRPEFNPMPARAGRNPSILLSLGGGDASAHLPVLAAALTLPALSGWTLRVIAGCMPTEAIKNALHGVAARLEILPRVDDMPSLLADTEICISAGGSTCWELCHMGIPFLTVEVAKNQHNICDWLDRHSYAPRFSSAAFMELLKSAELRSIRSTILRNLVDGYGAKRTINSLENLFKM